MRGVVKNVVAAAVLASLGTPVEAAALRYRGRTVSEQTGGINTVTTTLRLTAVLVDPVTAFSLGGLATVGSAARRRARAR